MTNRIFNLCPIIAVLLVVFLVAAGSVSAADTVADTAGAESPTKTALPRVCYRSFWPQERYNRQFADAGVKLVFIYPSNTICSLDVPYSNYPQIWTGPNQYNWKSLDDHIDDVLKWNPRAKLMVMIDLNTPPWWIKSHDGADSFNKLAETVLREDFKRDLMEYMRNFLRHTESKYKDKIVTYQLSCGSTCEWYDRQRGKPGPLKHEAFAQWMKRPGLKVPEDREKTSHYIFYDPVKDADKIAYWKFHNRLVTDAMLDFAAEARRTINGRVPLGTFFGYIMELGGHRLLYEGHLDYDRVFQSPLIGYNTAPADYANRSGGGTGGFLYCIDSLLANNKAAWHEIDHRTHCIKDSKNIGTRRLTQDGKQLNMHSLCETVATLRREFAMAMIHGSHLWWFDMFGGWFDDPVIMADMKKMTAISERFAETGPGKAEVAVVVDADSMYYVAGHSQLADIVLRKLQFAMFAGGVPWRCYSFADLPKLDMSPYKVVILPNLFNVTPEKRKLLDEKLLRDGKAIVLPFAPGIITDGKYDTANIAKLTGVKVDKVSRPPQPQKAIYKKHGDWTSVFLTRPQMSPKLLRDIFSKADVHIYSEDGEPFYVNDELMALHTAKGGPRTFHLPRPCRVVELFDDREVSPKPVTMFTEDFPPMTTRLYHLIPEPRP